MALTIYKCDSSCEVKYCYLDPITKAMTTSHFKAELGDPDWKVIELVQARVRDKIGTNFAGTARFGKTTTTHFYREFVARYDTMRLLLQVREER